ncbi:MAG: TetR/AcrR family transcriptional regulator [Pseudomonadota bacterium]
MSDFIESVEVQEQESATKRESVITDFMAFKESINLTEQEIYQEIYRCNQEHLQVKEATAIKNLKIIVSATLELANEKGFQAMSLRDLSAKTSMSMGALYTYIRSKEDLVRIIQGQGLMLAQKIFYEQIENIEEPHEKLIAALRIYLYMSEIMRSWFYFSYMEAKNLTGPEKRKALETELQSHTTFSDVIHTGIEKGVFNRVNVELTAATFKALLQDWYLKPWKYEHFEISVDDYAQYLEETANKMLSVQA